MKILGLTGPSGAGKGAVCDIFKTFGIPSIDTDAVYHQLLEEGGIIKDELCAAFGQSILDENGKIDRKKLGAAVFGKENTPSLLHTLNAITHKYVMARTHGMMQTIKQSGALAVLIDAPLLFEAGIDKECDAVIGVLADRETRLSRITQRDHITANAAQMRMDAQKSDDFYRKACKYILENNNDYTALEAQIRRLLKELGLEV
ncbi:MAG: dephospho-CoA kinase [Clostridia bacterium]|nr:dephospho-CoA kinase [Clostridia bacterium]